MKTRLTAMRPLMWLLLTIALLAPKFSLAFVALSGSQDTSIIICTGTGLIRVTISSDGGIVEPDRQVNASVPCVLPDDRSRRFERSWQHLAYAQFRVIGQVESSAQVSLNSQRLTAGLSSRGPPPAT